MLETACIIIPTPETSWSVNFHRHHREHTSDVCDATHLFLLSLVFLLALWFPLPVSSSRVEKKTTLCRWSQNRENEVACCIIEIAIYAFQVLLNGTQMGGEKQLWCSIIWCSNWTVWFIEIFEIHSLECLISRLLALLSLNFTFIGIISHKRPPINQLPNKRELLFITTHPFHHKESKIKAMKLRV